jgi:hypothetical protein
LRVVALVDPSLNRSNAVLQQKRATSVELAYRDTVAAKTIDEFVEQMQPHQRPSPHILFAVHPELSWPRLFYFFSAIIIGSPPAYRGSDLPGADIELKLIKYFPGVAMFVEKPVATGSVEHPLKVAKAIKASGAICSVGYVLTSISIITNFFGMD